jgi:hypothetical protein
VQNPLLYTGAEIGIQKSSQRKVVHNKCQYFKQNNQLAVNKPEHIMISYVILLYEGSSESALFPQTFFAYLSDITNVLFLNTTSLLLNTLCPFVYKLFKGIRIEVLWLCAKSVMHYLLHITIRKLSTSQRLL